jgi:hypothetical protein
MPVNSTDQESNGVNGPGNGGDTAVTPALVRKIADKVYTMLLLDLRVERERQRMPRRPSGHGRGER